MTKQVYRNGKWSTVSGGVENNPFGHTNWYKDKIMVPVECDIFPAKKNYRDGSPRNGNLFMGTLTNENQGKS